MTKCSRQSRRALTLVEVLAVVVILGIIAGMIAIGVSGAFGRSKHELGITGVGIVVSRVNAYYIENGSYPTTDVGLDALTDGQADPGRAYYMTKSQLLDPWDRQYLYVTPGPDGHPFEVLSYGRDGQPGGEGEDADITSTNLRGDRANG